MIAGEPWQERYLWQLIRSSVQAHTESAADVLQRIANFQVGVVANMRKCRILPGGRQGVAERVVQPFGNSMPQWRRSGAIINVRSRRGRVGAEVSGLNIRLQHRVRRRTCIEVGMEPEQTTLIQVDTFNR